MRACTISGHGNVDDLQNVLKMVEDHPRPLLSKRAKGDMLVRVLACSMAPGDVRVLSGRTSLVQSPPAFPYVAGGDICGVVEEAGPKAKFKKGDHVISMFSGLGPWDGLADFKICKSTHTARKPSSLSAVEAAALPSSALSAMVAADVVQKGDRVLMLGAGGGVGPFLLQLCRHRGASFICAATTQPQQALELGASMAIDSRTEDWKILPALRKEPVDVIFDLGLSPGTWEAAKTCGVIKPRPAGRYVPFGVIGDPHPKAQHVGDVLKIMFKMHAACASAARLVARS